MSVNSISPQTLFGGTWTQIKDRFLLACGDTYANGATGGEATHKLTVNEMPKHNHRTCISHGAPGGGSNVFDVAITGVTNSPAWSASTTNDLVGGDSAHNNMPPYLAVYIWKRTA